MLVFSAMDLHWLYVRKTKKASSNFPSFGCAMAAWGHFSVPVCTRSESRLQKITFHGFMLLWTHPCGLICAKEYQHKCSASHIATYMVFYEFAQNNTITYAYHLQSSIQIRNYIPTIHSNTYLQKGRCRNKLKNFSHIDLWTQEPWKRKNNQHWR